MTNPAVCCVCLTKDRPEMTKRAIASFRAQSYANKRLLILDNAERADSSLPYGDANATSVWMPDMCGKTIGELRNAANWCASDWASADILCHWDSDDLSHPNRIAEQVALLQANGADAVGYSDLLFWKFPIYGMVTMPEGWTKPICEYGEAWLYSRPTRFNVPGTTLCYWRKTWERKPFPHLPEAGNPTSQGEDIVWQAGLKVVAISSVKEFVHLHPDGTFAGVWDQSAEYDDTEPRMIASVHSGNTMAAGYSHMGHVEEFARTPEWDSYCERVMKP